MSKLPYIVECKSIFPFFEPIAAFNVDSVAFHYARDCVETNPLFTYRVTKSKKVLGVWHNEFTGIRRWIAE